MSTKRITVGVTDSTANNLTNRDSLEVTFTPTAYPLTASNVTNCSVSPTSISATTNIFTATFPNENEGAYSFTLSNSAPAVPDGDFGKISGNTNPSLSQSAFLSQSAWTWQYSSADDVYANSNSYTIDGHQLPYGSNSYTIHDF